MVERSRRRGLTLIEVVAALALMAGVLTAALVARSRLVEQAQRAELRQEAVALLEVLSDDEAEQVLSPGSFYSGDFFVVVQDREPASLDALGLMVRRVSVFPSADQQAPALAYVERFAVRPTPLALEGGRR
ncbi:MAG: type II secretion system protein [Planctomycetota bacterium]